MGNNFNHGRRVAESFGKDEVEQKIDNHCSGNKWLSQFFQAKSLYNPSVSQSVISINFKLLEKRSYQLGC
jgi:hypothetical protein